MKKKIMFLFLIIILSVGTTSIVLANREIPENADQLNEIAQNVAESTQSLFQKIDVADLQSYNNTDKLKKPYLASDATNAVGEIMGDLISYQYFEQRVNSHKAIGSSDAIADAWNGIKKEVCEFHYAEENGLLPSYEEVIERTKQECEIFDTDLEAKGTVQYLLEQIGLTWDEYWNLYKPHYEMPVQMIRENIHSYLQDNGLEDLDYSNIDIIIFDQSFIDSLER